ncbi:MAG: acyl-CoA dehydrogenase family protein [Spongiibacteraceae bacterium]|jgi:3-hydroxy-9,10-secoandrosta-1,3,5(10)-triene-9,17-dione monooxygenase
MSSDIPSSDELVSRAIKLLPSLKARASHCEDLRQIPGETVDDYINAGFLRMAVPKKFGGYGYGLDTIVRIGMEVGRGCGSSAWMAGQWPGPQFMFSYFSDEAQQLVWGDWPDVLSSTASAQAKVDVQPERGGCLQ